MNPWNLIGVAAWILLLGYLIFLTRNIRHRHIKMIVVHGKRLSGRTVLIDLAEVAVFLLAFWGLIYAAWMRPADYTDAQAVTVTHEYAPLVLQTDGEQSYYVAVRRQSAKTPVSHYTYWREGTKVQVTSQNAALATENSPLPVAASAYPWSKDKLLQLDKQTDRAFAATVSARHEGNFLNGLGMRAGRRAAEFTIIRIPGQQFIDVQPLK